MKRALFLGLGIGLIVSVLVIRESVILKEIETNQVYLRNQIQSSMESAQSSERLGEIQSSKIAFERYLEPILMSAQRLVWQPSREQLVQDWKREVHQRLDDAAHLRSISLQQSVEEDIEKTRKESAPSIDRMMAILKKSKNSPSQFSCVDVVDEEMAEIKSASLKTDSLLLREVSKTGVQVLKQFQKKIKSMNSHQLNAYLSNQFMKQVQDPILEGVLKIKSSALRLKTWNELREKIISILEKKQTKLHLSSKEDSNKNKLSKLLEEKSDILAKEFFAPEASASAKKSVESIAPEPEISSMEDENSDLFEGM